jgi:hypothetical protein
MVVAARAIILTGYSDRLHTRSTGTREMSADGIALAACRRDARQHGNAVVAHQRHCPSALVATDAGYRPMLGSRNRHAWATPPGGFFNQRQDDPLAFGPYTQLKALAKQVRAGKARYDGSHYAGFDHCDAAEVDACTTYGKTYRQLGLAFPTVVGPRSSLSAGRDRRRYKTMRSSVPKLYVAGGLVATVMGCRARHL